MNLDGITLHCITNELVSILQGGAISKYINSTNVRYISAFSMKQAFIILSLPWMMRLVFIFPTGYHLLRMYRQDFACFSGNITKMAVSPL